MTNTNCNPVEFGSEPNYGAIYQNEEVLEDQLGRKFRAVLDCVSFEVGIGQTDVECSFIV